MAAPQPWPRPKKATDARLCLPVEGRTLTVEEIWFRTKTSILLGEMHTTYESIKKDAAALMFDELLYLQPQDLICQYILERPGVIYDMQLVLSGLRLDLSFSFYGSDGPVSGSAI